MNIVQLYNSYGQIKENTWLDGRSYSDAFVLCISSGPWRQDRRFKIQKDAISFVAGRDLSEINSKISFFPLMWQNSFLNSIIHFLQFRNQSMTEYCNDIISIYNETKYLHVVRFALYTACNCPKGSKVLSLFMSDKVKSIPCFTIDRHVKFYLKEHNLPQTEVEMVKLCDENNIDPRLFSLAIAQSAGIKNPNWSI